ncbi:MAG TPA: PAS domain S-box protein, partial [Ktedonobacterales bacterium]|nr:PAS domain S-box protein [Ktedonobacterales bacterium]
MRDAPSRMNRLPTQLKMNIVAFVDRARTTLRPRAAGWRAQTLSLQDREKRRAAWPLLVYAVGFLIAESATWLLAFALSPKVEYSSPLFMQGAVAVAALLLVPPKRWWIYLVLTLFLLPVNAWLFHGSPSWSVFLTLLFLYLGIVCLAVGTASLVRRFVAAPPRFASVREVSRFMLCVAVVSIVPACVFTAGRIVIFDWTFWFSWETAYFGFVLAMPVFTPAIVLWARTDVRGLRAMSRGRWIEVVFVVLGLLVVSVLVFGARYQVSGLPHAMILLLVPLLLWAAVRFGPRGITTALSLTALLAIIGAINGVGPFVGPSAQANVFALQLFLISVGMPLFILAAATQERAEVDKALRTSEERYRGVVETQTELVSRYLPDTTMIFLNDAGCRFYDKPREELLGTRWIDLVPKSAHERVQMEIQSLLEHPGTITIEHEAMFPDGSLRWQQWVNRTICDAEGRVVELQSVGRDITEHKQAAEALRASEARYRAVVETQTEMITRYRPDTTLTFVNDATCRFDGKSREELLGTSILADMPEEAAARVQAMIQALLAEPDPGIRTIEHQSRFQDGSLHWQQWVNRTILDADGQVIELQGIGRDITERKQAEEALRASEARYRAVVRNLPHSAVLLFDEELRHSFADGPGLQVLGLTPARLEGRTVWEAFPPELAAALAPHYEAALAGQAVEQDVAHGQQIYHLQVVPMPAIEAPAAAAGLAAERPEALPENHARAGMVALQDVTEQWRARDELAHERTLTAVLGAIGQEFRTLADHSPDVIVRLDSLGRALYVNPAGAELLGRPARHWIGKTAADIGMPEEITARWAQRLRDVVVTGAPATFDVVVHVPDGQVHALH